MSEFTVRISNHRGVTVVSSAGRVDTGRIGRLEEVINDQLELGVRHLVVDCTDITFIASSALRVFLVTHRKLKNVGIFLVAGLQPHLLKMVRTAGFDTLIEVRADVSEALSEAEELLPESVRAAAGGGAGYDPDLDEDVPWRPEVPALARHAFYYGVPLGAVAYYFGAPYTAELWFFGLLVAADAAVCFGPPELRDAVNAKWRSVFRAEE